MNFFQKLLGIGLLVTTAFSAATISRAEMMVQQAHPGAIRPGRRLPGPAPLMLKHLPSLTRLKEALATAPEPPAEFKKRVHLAVLKLLAVQNNDQIKTLDSWARQSIQTICGFSSINGENPLYTALDMAFRPQAWQHRDCIYIQTVPIRQRLGRLVAPAEAKRILWQGTVSPAFLASEPVGALLRHISSDAALNSSVAQISNALYVFKHLFEALRLVPPAPPATSGTWLQPLQLIANLGPAAAKMDPRLARLQPRPGYSSRQAWTILMGLSQLAAGWRARNARSVNAGIAQLAAVLPRVNPAAYPSRLKRGVEIWYNRLFNGTIVGVGLYFIALTLFLIAAVGAYPAARRPALFFFTLAVAVHAAFMAVRWWLAGRIPIQNEFESVLASAFAGCVIGLILEYWKKTNLFGLAMSFVGFLAMTACFVVPYVLGHNIGENIGRVDGVLNSYWLYIHVNVVVSSYALIGASFCLALLYLLVKLYYRLRPLGETALAGASSGAALAGARGEAGGTAMLAGRNVGGAAAAAPGRQWRENFLRQLDAANIVVLQMGFWFLGTGIVLGAVWASYSWGRPWEWDPKETFSLVTGVVYLIIVHLRFVTPKYRPDWTAWLAVIGFAVMLFNWIGVNYFLVGLHSYA